VNLLEQKPIATPENELSCGENTPSYEYKVGDKRVFIVTPVYREDSGKTIHDALLNLMLIDS